VVYLSADYARITLSTDVSDDRLKGIGPLRDHPAKFADLEARIHQTFQGLADQVVAGVLAQVTAADDFAQDAKKK
jgi:hypothetical protein